MIEVIAPQKTKKQQVKDTLKLIKYKFR
jgi:hypothetical protein